MKHKYTQNEAALIGIINYRVGGYPIERHNTDLKAVIDEIRKVDISIGEISDAVGINDLIYDLALRMVNENKKLNRMIDGDNDDGRTE